MIVFVHSVDSKTLNHPMPVTGHNACALRRHFKRLIGQSAHSSGSESLTTNIASTVLCVLPNWVVLVNAIPLYQLGDIYTYVRSTINGIQERGLKPVVL